MISEKEFLLDLQAKINKRLKEMDGQTTLSSDEARVVTAINGLTWKPTKDKNAEWAWTRDQSGFQSEPQKVLLDAINAAGGKLRLGSEEYETYGENQKCFSRRETKK
ncbi:MAG: hypothetical protein KGI38_11505 [Thaumarchaeota archaeon]|nr:hypothetical protein [Nitrososphaerota archaeon]